MTTFSRPRSGGLLPVDWFSHNACWDEKTRPIILDMMAHHGPCTLANGEGQTTQLCACPPTRPPPTHPPRVATPTLHDQHCNRELHRPSTHHRSPVHVLPQPVCAVGGARCVQRHPCGGEGRVPQVQVVTRLVAQGRGEPNAVARYVQFVAYQRNPRVIRFIIACGACGRSRAGGGGGG